MLGLRLKWLLVFALFVRSLVPLGIMIAPSLKGDGSVSVVICTGSGPQLATLADDGKIKLASKHTPSDQKTSSHDACPFASQGAVDLASNPITVASAAHYSSITYRLDRVLFSETPQPGAHSARGPPSILS